MNNRMKKILDQDREAERHNRKGEWINKIKEKELQGHEKRPWGGHAKSNTHESMKLENNRPWWHTMDSSFKNSRPSTTDWLNNWLNANKEIKTILIQHCWDRLEYWEPRKIAVSLALVEATN